MNQIIKFVALALVTCGFTLMSQAMFPEGALHASALVSQQVQPAPSARQQPPVPAELPPEMAEFANIEITPIEQLLMRKLDLTSDLLEAIITKDSESLQEYTQELIGLTESEEWGQLSDSADYQTRSEQFQKAVRALRVMSKGTNPRAISKTYYNVLEQCMGCHMGSDAKRAE